MNGSSTDRLPTETAKAYSAFCWWVGEVPRPELAVVAEHFGRREGTVRQWSSRYSWADRARLSDQARLEAQLAHRDADRETARQQLVDALPKAVAILLSLADGKLLDEGDRMPMLDRHGKPMTAMVEIDGEVREVAITKPYVSPTERRKAAQTILETSGVAVPKRMELTGPDGTEIKIRARHALSDLTGKQLAALALALEVDL